MEPEEERTPNVVRPFRASIVRQDRAAQHVSPMLDALQASKVPVDAQSERVRGIDPDAYDESPTAIYIYRLRRGDDEHVGVVGDVTTEAFVDGTVRGHEAVQPARVEALVDHFASATVRSELVALLHESGPAVRAVVDESLRSDPMIRFTGPDDWEQTVWRVSEPASRVLCEELSRGIHYVADGHHRVAASLNVWEGAERPSGAGVICVIYPFDGLRLLAFHRRVAGPVPSDKLFGLLSEAFDLRDIVRPDESTGVFGLYVEGRWYDASYRGARLPGAAGLDISILNSEVVEPLLGICAPADPGLEIASALSALTDLMQACDQDGGALFVLRPPTLEQLIEVADRGEVMPPKTTYFDPKPFAGIFLR